MNPQLTQLVVHNAHETEANRNNAIVPFSQPTEEVETINESLPETNNVVISLASLF